MTRSVISAACVALAAALGRSVRIDPDVATSARDADPDWDTVHKALLAGLLSHVGARDQARREYAGLTRRPRSSTQNISTTNTRFIPSIPPLNAMLVRATPPASRPSVMPATAVMYVAVPLKRDGAIVGAVSVGKPAAQSSLCEWSYFDVADGPTGCLNGAPPIRSGPGSVPRCGGRPAR